MFNSVEDNLFSSILEFQLKEEMNFVYPYTFC